MITKYINRTSGLIVVGAFVVATFTVGILYSGKSEEKPINRIRVEQEVDYNELMDDGDNYVLKTKIYIDGVYQSTVTDFGEVKEIDMLKCIRYKQAKLVGINLVNLNEKKCN